MHRASLLILILLAAACTYHDNAEQAPVFEAKSLENLTGSWLLYERGFSPGSGYEVVAVPAIPEKLIRFGSDGSFESNTEGYEKYRRYRIEEDGDATVLAIATSEENFSSSTHSLKFTLTFRDNALFLYTRWCIEGCHEAYKKISDSQPDQNP